MMTDRIRSQHGNVIAADFSKTAAINVTGLGSKPTPINIPVSVETLYADGAVIVLRCTVGTHTWHMLGDVASGKCFSTT